MRYDEHIRDWIRSHEEGSYIRLKLGVRYYMNDQLNLWCEEV